MAAHITVVGAGVIGLTTAVELTRRGHRVTVVAERVFPDTLSAVAGAVWFPYQVGPDDSARVARLAHATRRHWIELGERAPHAGIDLLRFYEIDELAARGELPWWAGDLAVEIAPAPVPGAPPAWVFSAPRAQPSLLLPHLLQELACPIEHARVDALAALPGDFLVNCTGLGARALAADPELHGVHGLVVMTEPGGVPLDVTITDHRDPDSFFYVIPRRDELVLGGLAEPVEGTTELPPDPKHVQRILDHAARLGLRPGAVRSVRTGLRPVRATLRVERDLECPRLFHNYGHGGAGFTLAYGAACEIAQLIERA